MLEPGDGLRTQDARGPVAGRDAGDEQREHGGDQGDPGGAGSGQRAAAQDRPWSLVFLGGAHVTILGTVPPRRDRHVLPGAGPLDG
jgi:hypothetical protein